MAAATPELLIVVGNDEGIAETETGFRVNGSTNLYRLLGDDVPYHRLQLTPHSLATQGNWDVSRYRTIMNLITEPEGNATVLAAFDRLVTGFRGKVINRPAGIRQTTRDGVARLLQGIDGLVVPPVIRIDATDPAAVPAAVTRAGLEFPALLREAGKHTGEFVGRFDTVKQVIVALPSDGELLLTQFVDFCSADGLYRKYRVFFIGNTVVARHMLVSDDWNVHAADRTRFVAARSDLIAEEEAFLTSPDDMLGGPVRIILSEIRRRIPLDFFGMDFSILPDGRLLLFEANATMNFFPFSNAPEFAYVLRGIPPARAALKRLLGITASELAPAPARPWGFAVGDAAARTK